MSKHTRPLRPLRPAHRPAIPEPAYPTLARDRKGATRRGFLLAALGTSAAAVTRCMGAPPRPSYPPARWRQVTLPLEQPVTITGCGIAVERQTFAAVTVSCPRRDLVRRLSAPGNRLDLQRRIARLLGTVACNHSTLATQRRRVETTLRTELRTWYRGISGVWIEPRDITVTLQPTRPSPT